MYIKRNLRKAFQSALNQYPAVLITGPRQSGKTTFLKNEINQKTTYVLLDDPIERMRVHDDPLGFISQFEDKPVLLDEIQYAPELLPYIEKDIEKNKQAKGKWIITSSQEVKTLINFRERLAGRIQELNLFPFHANENIFFDGQNIESLIWQGGYPENILYSKKRDSWFSEKIQIYIERDIRQLIQIQDLGAFQTFLGLCASLNGQELNIASLSRHVGITQPTCKKWISILQASFIIILIPPYFQNFGKRVIKSQKIYFLDQAMAVYLTKQPDPQSMYNGAMGNTFFEGFIVTEIYKSLISNNKNANCYFWRSHDGLAVDLIIETNGNTWPIEIKKNATPSLKHAESLIKFKKIANNLAFVRSTIVCNVAEKTMMTQEIEAMSWKDFLKIFDNN
jgi:hypothetical protein